MIRPGLILAPEPDRAPPAPAAQGPANFDWPLAYAAEKFLRQRMTRFLELNSFAGRLSERMRDETGTDFFEWMDHMVLAATDEKALRDIGFVTDEVQTPDGGIVLKHPLATLPRIVLMKDVQQSPSLIALRPESVADFVAAHSLAGPIDGMPYSRYRRVLVSEENGTRLEAVERNAYRGSVSVPLHISDLKKIIHVRELWRIRRRHCASDVEGFAVANRLLDESVDLIGQDMSCQIFFEEERRYWENRNHAARIQKHRQDLLGLGWGNHDHHTFRCSREHFVDCVAFLVRLGFKKRERYYAGAEAGWSAQISEQPNVGIVVFADVDLMPDETQIDFSSTRLAPAPRLGTVGLWCGLHGESFLEAGMHHLEARFDFDLLRAQLEECGVQTMKPFSNFEFLRQAFTEGERWPVCRTRLDKLTSAKLITRDQAKKFLAEGAIGSHLENLQRRGGFKGFNQKAVSAIISATDPRQSQKESALAMA